MVGIAAKIIEACKKGDAQAQKQFYTLFYKPVYNSCYRILLNAADAEDCMQESFLKAFEKIKDIEDAVPEAWLRRIAINTAIDKLRKRRLEFVDLDEQQFAEETADDEEDVQWKVEQVKEAVKKLPENHRLVLNLNLFEGYDYEEIAGILNIREVTVRSQFSRARQKLIEIIKEEKKICV